MSLENKENKDRTEVLEALWKKVMEDWNNEAVHDQFISKCREMCRLDFAVSKYLEREGDDLAKRKIEQIQLIMEYDLKAMLKQERINPSKINYTAWFLFFLIASIILWTILLKLFK